jgi:peptidoglycan/LPS O-acetylase OafA/YrhL
VREHRPQLDGLRAIAILLVLVTHFWSYPAGHTIVNRFAAAGWTGVDLFFVLSGYLITLILWDTREQPGYFRNFYARRALRIFPIYYLLLAFVFILLPTVSRLPPQLVSDGWMYALYLANIALASSGWVLFLIDITWSLSVEEQFYLIWPFIVKRVSYRQMVAVCIATIVIAPLLRYYLWAPDRWMWLHMMMPLRADAFAFGGLVALLSARGVKLPARSVLLLTSCVLAYFIATGEFRRESMLVGTFGYSLTAMCAAAAVLCAVRGSVLGWRPLTYVGKVSYGMYLYHPICLMIASTVLARLGFTAAGIGGGVMQLVILTAITLLAASISFWLIEARLLRLKRHFETPRPAAGQGLAGGTAAVSASPKPSENTA